MWITYHGMILYVNTHSGSVRSLLHEYVQINCSKRQKNEEFKWSVFVSFSYLILSKCMFLLNLSRFNMIAFQIYIYNAFSSFPAALNIFGQ